MSVSTINISLPEQLKAAVDEVIAAEGYGNTSEFFRDLVRNYLKIRQEQQLEAILLRRLGDETVEEFDSEKVREALAQRLNRKK